MLGKIVDQIQKDHGAEAVTGIYLSLISDIKKKVCAITCAITCSESSTF